MQFSEFERQPPAALPPNVSDIYYKLWHIVAAGAGTENARIVKFCIAYTLYCVQKRDSVLHALEKGRSPDHTDIARPFEAFQQDRRLLRLVEEGEEILASVIRDVENASFVEIRNQLRKAIRDSASGVSSHLTASTTKVSDLLRTIEQELSTQITNSGTTITASLNAVHSKLPQARTRFERLGDFFLESWRHGGYIIVASLSFSAVALALKVIYPPIVDATLHFIELIVTALKRSP
jgi:hypothetical protein